MFIADRQRSYEIGRAGRRPALAPPAHEDARRPAAAHQVDGRPRPVQVEPEIERLVGSIALIVPDRAPILDRFGPAPLRHCEQRRARQRAA
jgi:hypothetical protein